MWEHFLFSRSCVKLRQLVDQIDTEWHCTNSTVSILYVLLTVFLSYSIVVLIIMVHSYINFSLVKLNWCNFHYNYGTIIVV